MTPHGAREEAVLSVSRACQGGKKERTYHNIVHHHLSTYAPVARRPNHRARGPFLSLPEQSRVTDETPFGHFEGLRFRQFRGSAGRVTASRVGGRSWTR